MKYRLSKGNVVLDFGSVGEVATHLECKPGVVSNAVKRSNLVNGWKIEKVGSINLSSSGGDYRNNQWWLKDAPKKLKDMNLEELRVEQERIYKILTNEENRELKLQYLHDDDSDICLYAIAMQERRDDLKGLNQQDEALEA